MREPRPEAAGSAGCAGDGVGRWGSWALVGVLFVLVAITLPELGSDPWRFRPGSVDPQGPLSPLVRAAGEEWDLGIPRASAFLAALLCGAAAIYLLVRPRALSRGLAIALMSLPGRCVFLLAKELTTAPGVTASRVRTTETGSCLCGARRTRTLDLRTVSVKQIRALTRRFS